MSDLLKLAAALTVVVLGTRLSAWGEETPKGGSKVFPYPTHVTVLENGLKVEAVPFDSPGLIAYWTVVRAGSRNEIEPGKSGFAHFFEHMMFRGTDTYARDRYNAVLKELGADHNAFTTDDYTAYHILAPASSLETIVRLESDRFMNLKYSAEDFKKEAGAVLGDQGGFHERGFHLGGDRVDLQRVDLLQDGPPLGGAAGRRREIGAEAHAQVFRLADVKDPSPGIEEAVHAGRCRQGLQV